MKKLLIAAAIFLAIYFLGIRPNIEENSFTFTDGKQVKTASFWKLSWLTFDGRTTFLTKEEKEDFDRLISVSPLSETEHSLSSIALRTAVEKNLNIKKEKSGEPAPDKDGNVPDELLALFEPDETMEEQGRELAQFFIGKDVEYAWKQARHTQISIAVIDSMYKEDASGNEIVKAVYSPSENTVLITVAATNPTFIKFPKIEDLPKVQAEALIQASGFTNYKFEAEGPEAETVIHVHYDGKEVSAQQEVPENADLIIFLGNPS